MRVREWMNNNSVVVTILAAVILVAALGLVVMQFQGPTYVPPNVYYWNLDTNEVFVQRADAVPPIQAPNGGEGVRAYLFSCGECSPDQWFGYLQKFDEEGKRLQEQGEVLLEEEDHLLVRSLEGGDWVPIFSAEGTRIHDVITTRECDGAGDQQYPRECRPE